jgi:prevent-host-death family protein
MITVNMHEAKTRLSELVRAVEEQGEIVTICRQGKPVVRLAAVGSETVDHFRTDRRLKGKLIESPMAGVPEAAWPKEYR